MQCIDNLVDNLNTYFPGRKITFITGVMADKDFRTTFESVIPIAKQVVTITPDTPRVLARKPSEAGLARKRRGRVASACSRLPRRQE